MTTTKTIDEQIKSLKKQIKPKPISGEEIDARIKDLEEQLDNSLKRPTQEKQIDELIKSLQKQLDAYQEPPSRAKQIDKQIKSLQEQINGCNETYLTKIEKAIDEEKNIISQLIDEQLKHQKRMEELEETLRLMQL